MLDIVLIVDHLWKHNILIIDWCCMCKNSGEFVDHLLLHFKVTRDIWSIVFALFGISWAMSKVVVQMLSC